jgi:hypothetical protein
MATNPRITPYGGPHVAYVVGDSDIAYYDLRLSNLTSSAEFMVTAPAGARVDVWSLAAGETTLRWDPAGIEVALLSGGAWKLGPLTLGAWTIIASAGAAATDPAVITIHSGSATGGPLRVRVREIRRAGLTAKATLQAQTNTETLRIVADPSIVGTLGPESNQLVEQVSYLLVGSPEVTVQQANALPAAPFGAVPPVRGDWARYGSGPELTLIPVGTSDASFTAPALYTTPSMSGWASKSGWAQVDLAFHAYYDLNGSATFSDGEPDHTEVIFVNVIEQAPPGTRLY